MCGETQKVGVWKTKLYENAIRCDFLASKIQIGGKSGVIKQFDGMLRFQFKGNDAKKGEKYWEFVRLHFVTSMAQKRFPRACLE